MPESPKQEKILLIEGDGAVGEQITVALKKDGYTAVAWAKNAADGLKALYDQLPHLVILDVVLPDADGYGILEKKRTEPMLTKIPLFLLSTRGEPIDMAHIPAGSVAEFLVTLHPNPVEISEKIDRFFSHATAAEMMPPKAANVCDNHKLLWVEDDKLIGSILAKKLNSSGFELHHAVNGEEAMKISKEIVPDVIVLDLVLPGMSGFDILAMMRQDLRLKKVPVMILSNLSKQSDIERAKALGAQKFLVKAAVSLDQIVQEIGGLCK